MRRRCYFDWAATAIPDTPGASGIPFGNPSSKHSEGREARECLEAARRRCAAVLGTSPDRLYFSSGATESNALVLHSLILRKNSSANLGLLYSAVEHPSIRENVRVLERLGIPGLSIGVEADGRVSRISLEKALEKTRKPRLAAIMAVNNETGSIINVGELSAILRSRGEPRIHIHSDIVQAVGKVPIDLQAWDLDSASLSAHKIGGPRGIGILYLRNALDPVYAGGGQEGGLRPGTENVAGAAALADSLERHARPDTVRKNYDEAAERWKRLIAGLGSLERCALIPADRAPDDPRFSPYILQAAFRGIPGEVMVRALDDVGFALSTGSACSAADTDRPVLAAMGIDSVLRFEGIRISQGWSTTMEDIEALIGGIREILRSL
jgi:cysteine desulfurase